MERQALSEDEVLKLASRIKNWEHSYGKISEKCMLRGHDQNYSMTIFDDGDTYISSDGIRVATYNTRKTKGIYDDFQRGRKELAEKEKEKVASGLREIIEKEFKGKKQNPAPTVLKECKTKKLTETEILDLVSYVPNWRKDIGLVSHDSMFRASKDGYEVLVYENGSAVIYSEFTKIGELKSKELRAMYKQGMTKRMPKIVEDNTEEANKAVFGLKAIIQKIKGERLAKAQAALSDKGEGLRGEKCVDTTGEQTIELVYNGKQYRIQAGEIPRLKGSGRIVIKRSPEIQDHYVEGNFSGLDIWEDSVGSHINDVNLEELLKKREPEKKA